MKKFVTENGTFLVSCLVAFLAFIGVLITNNRNKKNIRMQARIDWIENVRKQTANTLSSYHKLMKFRTGNEHKGLLWNFQKDLELLSLYFADDKDIDNKANQVLDKWTRFWWHNNKGKHKDLNLLIETISGKQESVSKDEISELKSQISTYLKIEWDRAKNGK